MERNQNLRFFIIACVLLLACLIICDPSFASSTAGNGQKNILSIFQTIDNQVRLVATTVMGILWAVAGFKVTQRGQTVEENSKLIIGGIMIGAGGWLASLLV